MVSVVDHEPGLTAVDADILAGDEACHVRAQVQHHVGDICGISHPSCRLLDGIRPYFDKFVFHANRDVEFTLAVLGNDAGAYGAFKLILDAYRG